MCFFSLRRCRVIDLKMSCVIRLISGTYMDGRVQLRKSILGILSAGRQLVRVKHPRPFLHEAIDIPDELLDPRCGWTYDRKGTRSTLGIAFCDAVEQRLSAERADC